MSEQIESTFSRWLRKRRKELGLTQDELGERVGYSGETIRKIEAGRRRPSKRLARLLARVVGNHASDLPPAQQRIMKASRGSILQKV